MRALGDPETQPLLMRHGIGPATLALGAVEGTLEADADYLAGGGGGLRGGGLWRVTLAPMRRESPLRGWISLAL